MTKLARYFTHSGHQKYTKVFADIVESYNSTYHSSIKMKPNDVSLNNQSTVLQNLYKSDSKMKFSSAKFKVGDFVIVRREKRLFEKGYAKNWSEDVFKIRAVNPTKPVTYLLETQEGQALDGSFYQLELSEPSN